MIGRLVTAVTNEAFRTNPLLARVRSVAATRREGAIRNVPILHPATNNWPRRKDAAETHVAHPLARAKEPRCARQLNHRPYSIKLRRRRTQKVVFSRGGGWGALPLLGGRDYA
jgi:hypothetical protein